MSISPSSFSSKERLAIATAGVLAISTADAIITREDTSIITRCAWHVFKEGALFCISPLLMGLDTPFHKSNDLHVLPPLILGATALIINRVRADEVASEAEMFAKTHARPLEDTEFLDIARLNSDGSLIVLPGEKKIEEPSLIPIMSACAEATLLGVIGGKCFGSWGPLCLTIARYIPRMIEDHNYCWAARNPEEQDLSFLSRKIVHDRNDPSNVVILLAKLHMKINRHSAQGTDCSVCLNAGGKYSVCQDPRHSMHYACCLEYIMTNWHRAETYTIETVNTFQIAPIDLPTCPACRGPITPPPRTAFTVLATGTFQPVPINEAE